MRFITFIFFLLSPALAAAGPDRVSILLGSEHFNATEDFQEFNPGLFLTWEAQRDFLFFDSTDFSVGAFYNSYAKVAPNVTVGAAREVAPGLDLGVFAGFALYPGDGDRFRVSVGDVIPLAGFQARYRNVFAQLIPLNGDNADAVLAVGLTFALE